MTAAEFVVGDSLPIIAAASQGDRWPSVFTSLPDAAETGQSIAAWRAWFTEALGWTMAATDPNGVAVFYQTDRRADGGLVSKASLVIQAAEQMGRRVLWHKVAVTTMGTRLFRPGYTHLIAVSEKAKPGRMTPDVFMAGPRIYPNATDSAALDVALRFIGTTGATVVADPFCGRGSIALAAARDHGMDSLSIDIDEDAVQYAADHTSAYAEVVLT